MGVDGACVTIVRWAPGDFASNQFSIQYSVSEFRAQFEVNINRKEEWNEWHYLARWNSRADTVNIMHCLSYAYVCEAMRMFFLLTLGGDAHNTVSCDGLSLRSRITYRKRDATLVFARFFFTVLLPAYRCVVSLTPYWKGRDKYSVL